MTNQKFIDRNSGREFSQVLLPNYTTQEIWNSFIGLADKPDFLALQHDLKGFLNAWNDVVLQGSIQNNDRLWVNLGGDSSGKWIASNRAIIEEIWKSGYPRKWELECAILCIERSAIIGITFEENDEYWVFNRSLNDGTE